MKQEISSNFTETNFSPVNFQEHGNLRVDTSVLEPHLATINNTNVVVEEVVEIASDCPVVLLKNEETGKFQLTALFGLDTTENLLVGEKGEWIGTYLPVGLEIQPFAMFINEEETKRLQINMLSPLVSSNIGVALFSNKKPSTYLIEMREQLEVIHDASLQTESFIESLVNRNLITQCRLIIEQANHPSKVISDFYTINYDEFDYMAEEDILRFHKMGYWAPIYAMRQSLNQFKRLASLKTSKEKVEKINVVLHIDSETEE